MSDRVQAEIVHGDAAEVEVVRESDPIVEKQDVGTSLESFVAQRKAEHPEWYQDPEESLEEQSATEDEQAGSEDTPEFAKEEAEQEEAAEAHTDEPESKALKRILAREAKLREDKTAFESEQAEFRDKLARWEQEKRLATIDPVAYLKTLDIPQEKLIDFAKAAYYESLGEAAPDEYRGQKESLALRREIEQLKARLEAKEKTPDVDQEAQERAVLAYQNSMLEATKTFDADEFPSVARVVEAYSEADVAADMFRVAQQYAERMGGEGAPLTPEQCLAEVEKHYEQLLGKLAPAEERKMGQQAQVSKRSAKKTLSNSMSSNVPPEKPLDGLSYEEVAARSRERFFKAMRGE